MVLDFTSGEHGWSRSIGGAERMADWERIRIKEAKGRQSARKVMTVLPPRLTVSGDGDIFQGSGKL